MYAGVDLGATNLRVAIGPADGTIAASIRQRTPHHTRGDAVADDIIGALETACGDAGISIADLQAVGIGSIGPLDLDEGAVTRGVNLPIDGPIPLVDPLKAVIDGPVRLVNDAVAGIIGEHEFEDAPDNAVFLTISTGIGGGAIVDGHVLIGRSGNAGEVGHFIVDPERRLECGCGRSGHWEAYCAGRNIPTFARHLHDATGVTTTLSLGELDAAAVFNDPTDRLASRVIEGLTTYNTIGVANLIHAFAPERVTIGGAVALRNPRHIIEPIKDRVPDVLMTTPPEIRATPHGEDAVLYGALAVALGER